MRIILKCGTVKVSFQTEVPAMDKREIELKIDYVRIQADLEKVVNVGADPHQGEKILEEMEQELRSLYQQLEALEK